MPKAQDESYGISNVAIDLRSDKQSVRRTPIVRTSGQAAQTWAQERTREMTCQIRTATASDSQPALPTVATATFHLQLVHFAYSTNIYF